MNRYKWPTYKFIPPKTLRPLDRVKLSNKGITCYEFHFNFRASMWCGTIRTTSIDGLIYWVQWDQFDAAQGFGTSYTEDLLEALNE